MTQTDGEQYHVQYWNNQCCQNDYTTQGNLQIQYNIYQVTDSIFYRIRTKIFIIYMEIQKPLNSQSNLEKEHSWRNPTP